MGLFDGLFGTTVAPTVTPITDMVYGTNIQTGQIAPMTLGDPNLLPGSVVGAHDQLGRFYDTNGMTNFRAIGNNPVVGKSGLGLSGLFGKDGSLGMGLGDVAKLGLGFYADKKNRDLQKKMFKKTFDANALKYNNERKRGKMLQASYNGEKLPEDTREDIQYV